MDSTLVVKSCGIGNFEWLHIDGEASTVAIGDSEALAEVAMQSAKNVFIAPADNITFSEVSFTAGEKKTLRQTLPYELEEDLIDDVEDLHFSLGDPESDKVAVAVVARDLVDQWLEPIERDNIELQQMIAELYVLPLRDNCWSLLLNKEGCLLRHGQHKGFFCRFEIMTVSLQMLLDELEQIPDKVIIYGTDIAREKITSQLPELLRGSIEWNTDNYWTMVESALVGGAGGEGGDHDTVSGASVVKKFNPISLLQGQYTRRLPWNRWWKMWRLALTLLAAALAVSLLSGYIRLSSLEGRNIDLRRQIEQSYRSAVPRGAIFDAEKQLQRKVNGLKGQSGEGFVSLFAQVSAVLAKTEGLTLQNLNYTEKSTEIRMTVIANNFEDVETVRSNLEKAGLTAELSGTSSEGGKTRARLKIRG